VSRSCLGEAESTVQSVEPEGAGRRREDGGRGGEGIARGGQSTLFRATEDDVSQLVAHGLVRAHDADPERGQGLLGGS